MAEGAVKEVLQQLMHGDSLPKHTNQFEQNCKAFKKHINLLFYYLKRLPVGMLHKLYQNKDIPIDYLIMVLQTIHQTGLNDDKQHSLQLLLSLTKTNKFDLAVKCLTKKEKARNLFCLSGSDQGHSGPLGRESGLPDGALQVQALTKIIAALHIG